MRVLEIEAVERQGPNGDLLWGSSIDYPVAGRWTEGTGLEVAGWVLGRTAPAVAVEMLHRGRVCRRARTGVARPDVAAVHPGAPGAERSGFHFATLQCAPGARLDLEVRAVLADQTRVSLGVIRARGRWQTASHGAGGDLVSLVIPCYRQARFLGEAIESALNQTYPHLEVIVVDDGSPDNAEAVARRYPGVCYVRQEKRGVSAARNAGLRVTNGEYLVFLDSDDRLLPGAVEAGLAALQAHPECAFVYGGYRIIGADGSFVAEGGPLPNGGDQFAALLRQNFIGLPAAVVYRRSLFEEIDAFDTSLSAAEDYDLYLRAARCLPIYGHGELVAEYRHHGNNTTHNWKLMLMASLSVLRAQWPYVKTNDRYRAAYNIGILQTKKRYAGQIIDDLHEHISDRKYIKAIGDTVILLRYYPEGLTSHVARIAHMAADWVAVRGRAGAPEWQEAGWGRTRPSTSGRRRRRELT